MKSIATLVFSFFMALASAAQSSEQFTEVERVGVPFVQPRDFGQVCPPDFDSTRDLIRRYLDDGLVGVIQPDELVLVFDVPKLTVDDFELLTDRNDAEVCRELDDHFGHLMLLMAKVHPEIKPQYHYEIAFYRARSQGMYIAVLSGPPIIWRHEPTRTRGVAQAPGPGSTVRFFDINVEPIRTGDVRNLIRNLPADDPSK